MNLRSLDLALQKAFALGEPSGAELFIKNVGSFGKPFVWDKGVAEIASKEAPTAIEILIEALVAAAQLEFATIPIYLQAIWTITDQDDEVARSIRAIVHEEMLHFALICNMLAALGEKPRITGKSAPTYPGKLPGGVHPSLDISLDGLTDSQLDVFLEIERPADLVRIDGYWHPAVSLPDNTISSFYATVSKAFHKLNPAFLLEKQVLRPSHAEAQGVHFFHEHSG